MENLPTPEDIEMAAAQAGLSISELCHRADVSLSTWYRWRKGDSEIKLATVQHFIDVINQAVASRKDAAA